MQLSRRREALRRLGASLCPRCRQFAEELVSCDDWTTEPIQFYDACGACHEKQEKRNRQYIRDKVRREARDDEWTHNNREDLRRLREPNSPGYRAAYDEYADDIEAALAGWQIGNGIVGPRR